jgi:uncharacterized UBP type Zn finger protein
MSIKFLPPPFGSTNLGNTCYFASLLQALLSCKSLNIEIMKLVVSGKKLNPVLKTYAQVIKTALHPMFDEQAKLKLAGTLWQSMLVYLKSKNSHREFGFRQEDSHEAFALLLECFEDYPEIMHLFTSFTESQIFCFKCYDWVSKNTNVIQEFEIHPNFKCEIHPKIDELIKKNKEDGSLLKHLQCRNATLEGYACPKCQDKSIKLESRSITQISDIIVMVCTGEYKKKQNKQFPETIELESPDEKTTYVYKPVAQIIHSGGQHGGHYWTVAQRNVRGKKIWCNLNDTSVTYLSDEFTTQSGMYTIIYEIDN